MKQSLINSIAIDRMDCVMYDDPDYYASTNHVTENIESVLGYFNLPYLSININYYNELIDCQYLTFSKVNAFLKYLKHLKKEFLTKDIKKDIKILINAKANNLSFPKVAELLHFNFTEDDAYYRFLYHEKFINDKLTSEELLCEITYIQKRNALPLFYDYRLYERRVSTDIPSLMSPNELELFESQLKFLHDYIFYDQDYAPFYEEYNLGINDKLYQSIIRTRKNDENWLKENFPDGY